MKLNLGCGHNYKEGYVNVDNQPGTKTDAEWDLEKTPWQILMADKYYSAIPVYCPIKANSVDEILAHHVLEHLGKETQTFLNIMREIHRILKPNATIEIRVPHHRTDNFFGDPTHVRPITPEMLSLFSKKNCLEFIANKWPNTPLAIYLDVDFELVSTNFGLTEHWGKRYNAGNISKEELHYAMMTYFNVIDEVTMVLRKVGNETQSEE